MIMGASMLKLQNKIVDLVEPFRRYKRRWYDTNGVELDYNVTTKDSYIRRAIKDCKPIKITVRVGKFNSLHFFLFENSIWFDADSRSSKVASYAEFLQKTEALETITPNTLKLFIAAYHKQICDIFHGIGCGNENKLLVQLPTGECHVYQLVLRYKGG